MHTTRLIEFSARVVFLALLAIVTAACSTAATQRLASNQFPKAEQHFDSGVELPEQGRLKQAISAYDEALRLNPQYAKAYNNRGFAYDNLGQYQRAIQDYDEAIRLDPKLALAYANRGVAYTPAWHECRGSARH